MLIAGLNFTLFAFGWHDYGSIFKSTRINMLIYFFFICFCSKRNMVFYCWFLANWQDLLVEAAGYRRSFAEQRMTFIEFDAKVIK